LRLNILKKLRTASLNSEFTGSYKKFETNSALFRPYSTDSMMERDGEKRGSNAILIATTIA